MSWGNYTVNASDIKCQKPKDEKIALTKRGITVHHLDGLIKCG